MVNPPTSHGPLTVAVARRIIERLEQADINYCALRHWGPLLEGEDIPEGELDLLVPGSDLARLDQELTEAGCKRLSRRLGPPWVRYRLPSEDGGGSIDIDVDGPTCLGVTYLPAEGILAGRVRRGFLFVPGREDGWVLDCLRAILVRRVDHPEIRRHLAEFRDLEEEKKGIIRDRLAEGVTAPLATSILTLVEHEAWEALAATRSRLLRHLLLSDPQSLAGYLRGLGSRLKRLFIPSHPRGALVALIGVDGSGKTTLATALAERLKVLGVPTALVYLGMGRGRMVPGLRQVGATVGLAPRPTKSPLRAGGAKARLRPALRDGLSLFDFALRYLVRILPHLRAGTCVITDRYAYDLWERPDVQGWTKRFLLGVYPKPDILVLLDRDASIHHKRRADEWEAQGLEERQEALRTLVAAFRKRRNADVLTLGSEDVDKSVEVVLRTMEGRGFFAAAGA